MKLESALGGFTWSVRNSKVYSSASKTGHGAGNAASTEMDLHLIFAHYTESWEPE